MTTTRADWRIVALLSLVPVIVGCADPRAPSLRGIDECTLGAIESVRQGEGRVVTECALQAPWALVGLPGRRLTTEELQKAGLSRTLAEMLAKSDADKNRWCVVQEFKQPPTSTDLDVSEIPIANTQCNTTELVIPEIVYTSAARIRLAIIRSSSGQATLGTLEPF